MGMMGVEAALVKTKEAGLKKLLAKLLSPLVLLARFEKSVDGSTFSKSSVSSTSLTFRLLGEFEMAVPHSVSPVQLAREG